MKNALVIMTALLPTTGHADLIRFAANLPNTKVHVLISGRTFEPDSSFFRWNDFNEHFKVYRNVVIVHDIDDLAPQEPSEMPDGFWEWWREKINNKFIYTKPHWDYVVASETYGEQLAKTLDATFIPYDFERVYNISRGTDVRHDMWREWSSILPETRSRYMVTATMFGQESVGKTTLSKSVSKMLGVDWIQEYARPYLETVGAEVTLKAMENIHAGQVALQTSAKHNAQRPVLVQDTDLYSTVGYYEIMGFDSAPDDCLMDARRLASSVYYLLPDDVDFEADPLRYGGDKRESTTEFWKHLLEKFNLPYVVVPEGNVESKTVWVVNDLRKRFRARTHDMANFVR